MKKLKLSKLVRNIRKFGRSSVLVSIAFFVLLLTWVVASPPGASNDDNTHLPSSYCGLGLRDGLCESSSTPGARMVPRGIAEISKCFWPERPENPGRCVTEFELRKSTQLVDSTLTNNTNLYPKIFYATNALLASSNLQGSIYLMRSLNALVFLLLFMLCYLVIDTHRRPLFLFSFLLCSIPTGFYIIGSNNPLSWGISSVATFWILYSQFWRTRSKLRLVAALGTCLSLLTAVGSRADAALYVALSSVIVCFVVWQDLNKRNRIRLILTTLSLVVVSLHFAFSVHQSHVIGTGFQNDVGIRVPRDVFFYNFRYLPELILGPFGYGRMGTLGWINTSIPPIVGLPVVALLFVLVFFAMVEVAALQRWGLIVLLFTLFSLPLYVLQKDLNQVGEYVQPRYFYPLIYVLIGMCALLPDFRALLRRRGVISSLLAFYLVIYSLSFWWVVQDHSTGNANISGFPVAWWLQSIPNPTSTWVISVLSFSFLLGTVYYQARRQVDSERTISVEDSP